MQMPTDANIPYEWQVGSERDKLIIIVPSWSQVEKTSYAVFMDKKTRELRCECKGFQMRGSAIISEVFAGSARCQEDATEFKILLWRHSGISPRK